MTRTRAVLPVAAAVVAVGALVACGQGVDSSPASADAPLSTASAPAGPASPSATPGDATATAQAEGDAPFAPLAQESVVQGSGSSSVVGVRTGAHEGWERVVLDLEGDDGDAVGWFANQVPEPVQDGSGDVLDVDGDTFLQVLVTGLANGATETADSAGRAAFIGTVDGPGDGSLVEEVHVGGAWEGQAQVLVGLDDAAVEYRVSRLESPARVVVDVR